jgi:hypothetical protein
LTYYARATAKSFCIPENSQPVKNEKCVKEA